MAIPEACQVWIDQRLEEELEEQPDTGKSFLAIGKDIAKEVERYFETKVKADTLRKRGRRLLDRTNVQPAPNPQNHTENPENQTISEKSNVTPSHPAKDGTNRGGKREGAGRPVKHRPTKEQKEEIFTPSFKTAYDALYDEVMMAKNAKWEHTSREAAAKYVKALLDFINL